MLQNTNESYCFFKSPYGLSFILSSLIDHQKSLTTSYTLYKQSFRNIPPLLPYHPAINPLEYCIPNECKLVEEIEDSIYNCNFSFDGDKFFVSTQRGMIIYHYNDTNQEIQRPLTAEADINGYDISWTITDCDLSDNRKFLVHSTLNPLLHCFDLEKMKYTSHFNLAPDLNFNSFSYVSHCPVFSLKISGDNNEIIAGCGSGGMGNNLKVFNIEKNKVVQSIKGHNNDINSICYLDRNSSAILLSASDDCIGKVWDLRALGMNQSCAGYLLGHHSGLTSITSRGDQIYCATNSKDQSLRLWDLRKLESSPCDKRRVLCNYDYRVQRIKPSQLESFRKMKQEEHFDNSIQCFYGHSVLRTLIRCHFSPDFLTNNRYLYSGSACGRIFVWDALSGESIAEYSVRKDQDIVRDCVWHPYKTSIMMTNLGGAIYEWELNKQMDYAIIEKNDKESLYLDEEEDEEEEMDEEDLF